MNKFDTFLNQLRHRRDSAQARVETLRLELEGLNKLVSALEELAATQTHESLEQLAEGLWARANEAASKSKPRSSTSPERIVNAVRDVLSDVGRPMKRGELVSALQLRGVEVPGKDPNKNLGTILWRHPKTFIQLSNLGYWLADRELEGVYRPAGTDD